MYRRLSLAFLSRSPSLDALIFRNSPHLRSSSSRFLTTKGDTDETPGSISSWLAENVRPDVSLFQGDLRNLFHKFYDRELSFDEWSTLQGRYENEFEDNFLNGVLHATKRMRGESTPAIDSLCSYVIKHPDIPMSVETASYIAWYLTMRNRFDDLFRLYRNLSEHHGSLPLNLYLVMIQSFCKTDRWRESLKLLETLESLATEITDLKPGHYEPLVIAAAQHGDVQLATDILEKHLANKNLALPSFNCCREYLSGLHQTQRSDVRAEILLHQIFMGWNHKLLYVREDVAQELKLWFEHCKPGGSVWKVVVTNTPTMMAGNCRNCGQSMESLAISPDEFKRLQQAIEKQILTVGDIFERTTPEEFEKFREFIEEGLPYDVVIDSLNVGLMRAFKGARQPGQTLLKVVRYYTDQGFKCLVIGRQHMLGGGKFGKHHMAEVQKLADCFFTNDQSEDDPFILYSTVMSGPGTKYVTRDKLRDHKFLLGFANDPGLPKTFLKWQHSSQVVIKGERPDGAMIFWQKEAYSPVVQQNSPGGDSWHFPIDNSEWGLSEAYPSKWLCVTRSAGR